MITPKPTTVTVSRSAIPCLDCIRRCRSWSSGRAVQPIRSTGMRPPVESRDDAAELDSGGHRRRGARGGETLVGRNGAGLLQNLGLSQARGWSACPAPCGRRRAAPPRRRPPGCARVASRALSSAPRSPPTARRRRLTLPRPRHGSRRRAPHRPPAGSPPSTPAGRSSAPAPDPPTHQPQPRPPGGPPWSRSCARLPLALDPLRAAHHSVQRLSRFAFASSSRSAGPRCGL